MEKDTVKDNHKAYQKIFHVLPVQSFLSSTYKECTSSNRKNIILQMPDGYRGRLDSLDLDLQDVLLKLSLACKKIKNISIIICLN